VRRSTVRVHECRINQIVQLNCSQLRRHVEWGIVENGLIIGFHLSDVSGDSDFMGRNDDLNRAPMEGIKIRYSPWNDALLPRRDWVSGLIK
jgi:hypothetical protein